MGRFFFTLTAALAEMERRLIGERTKTALSHKRSRNEKTGGEIPYGYDVTEGGILIKNDKEQKVIRIIRNLHAQGLSLRRICAELERQGFRTRPETLTGTPRPSPTSSRGSDKPLPLSMIVRSSAQTPYHSYQ